MKRDRYFHLGICVGSWITGALTSLRQDLLGKEGYLEYAEKHWISSDFTVPGAIVLSATALALIFWIWHLAFLDEQSETKRRS